MADKGGAKNYIVTGGAGFIGGRLAERLLDRGDNVWVVDNFSTGKEANIPAGADLIRTDIADAGAYARFPSHIDAVFHLAAQSSGEISFADPAADMTSNILGTLLLLDWSLKAGVKRLLFAGSMGAYGDVPDKPVSEDHACRPVSFYGISKLAGEHYIRLYQAKGLETTVFRIFNAYGPGQNLENLRQGMASIYLAYLIEGKPILVKGSVERFRDFVYIDDLIDAWLLALDNPVAFGKTYNLAGGKKTLVSDLLAELKAAWGAAPDYPVETAPGTPGDAFGVRADITLIASDLGWRPRTDLSAGLKRMVDWVRSGEAGEAKAVGGL